LNRLYFTTLFVVSFLTAAPLQWRDMPNPTGEPLFFSQYFLPGSHQTEENFYAWEKNGTLWHIHKGNWHKIIRDSLDLYQISYGMRSDSAIIRTEIGKDYSTRLSIFKDGKKVHSKYITNVPLLICWQLDEEQFIIAGDWGHFYILKDEELIQSDVPMRHHIYAAVRDSSGAFWCSVRDDAFYSLKNGKWNRYPYPADMELDASAIFLSRDSINSFITSKGQYFIRDGDEFSKLKNLYAGNFSWRGIQAVSRKFLYGIAGSFYEVHRDNWHLIPLKPGVYVQSALVLSQNAAILAMVDGSLLYGKDGNELLFRELSAHYGLSGERHSASLSAMIYDFNNNGLPDILLLNTEEKRSLTLFYQTDSMLFSDMTWSAGLQDYSAVSHIELGDVNKDGRGDLLLLTNDEGQYQVHTLVNHYSHFQRLHSVVINDSLLRNIEDMKLFDMDDDGLLDLVIASRYSAKSRKGALMWFKGQRNRPWGEGVYIDSTRFWHKLIRFADFDMDGEDDLLVGNHWGDDFIIYNVKGQRLTKKLPGYTRTNQLIPGDFFPDGLPDIVRLNEKSVELLRNEGNGIFSQTDSRLAFGSTIDKVIFLAVGDLNNDGLPDLFFCRYPHANQVWLNQGDGRFHESAEMLHLALPAVKFALLADIGAKNLYDIYGLAPEANRYWQNQQRYLDPKAILWRGLGKDYFLPSFVMRLSRNDSIKSVWSSPSLIFPVREIILPMEADEISFYDGGKDRKYQLQKGVITIYNPSEWLYHLEKQWFRLLYHLSQPKTWLMAGAVILAVLTALLFQYLGGKYLHWSGKVRQAMLIGSLTLFWLMLFFLSQNMPLIRYGLPLLMIFSVNVLPFFTALPVLKRLTGKSQAEKQERLLKELMVFAHGDWAMDNLNGLILLLKNLPQKKAISAKMVTTINERIDAFLEFTYPKLAAIIELGVESAFDRQLFEKLNTQLTTVQSELAAIKSNEEMLKQSSAEKLSLLKESISRIKQMVFLRFSCDAVKLINAILNEKRGKAVADGPHYHLILEENQDYSVLMPAALLADILDNLLQNGARAVEQAEKKEIYVILRQVAHLVQINVCDSGPGVDEAIAQQIFDMAVSGWGSSGKGLAISKSIAENYGGRLFLAKKSVAGGASFTLELTKIEKGNRYDS
jgi:signal transduction histidine kinase